MADIEMKWYVMRATSGKESKVVDYIDRMRQQDVVFASHVAQALVPTEKVVMQKNGKRIVKDKVKQPGYVYVEACLAGEIPSMLRNIPNVYDFLRPTRDKTSAPMALYPNEVARMLGSVDEEQVVPEDIVIPFEIGESVKVNEGPFSGFDGIIEEINNDKKKLKVMVKVFGRETPLELGFMQVEKQE